MIQAHIVQHEGATAAAKRLFPGWAVGDDLLSSDPVSMVLRVVLG